MICSYLTIKMCRYVIPHTNESAGNSNCLNYYDAHVAFATELIAIFVIVIYTLKTMIVRAVFVLRQ